MRRALSIIRALAAREAFGRRALAAGAGALILIPLAWILRPVSFDRLVSQAPAQRVILDRDGKLLGERLDALALRRETLFPAELTPAVSRPFLAAEDHRFRRHPGLDAVSILRALAANASARRIAQGGSTLTQQTARLWHPRGRNLLAKGAEALDALRLEWWLSKDEILAAWLTLAPFGNRVQGLRRASRVYLGKDFSLCAASELAWLAAIPSAPTRLNPLRAPGLTLARRDRILARMGELGFVDASALSEARRTPPVVEALPQKWLAPHFQEFLESRFPDRMAAPRVRTTLDRGLQEACERIVREQIARLQGRHVGGGAVVVLENGSGAVRAWVGSASWEAEAGQVDLVDEPRQPGSSLKPFTYLLALEKGFTAATALPDLPLSFPAATGTWEPQNYGGRWRGPVRLREALANSLNVPAVFTLHRIGVGNLLGLLTDLGIEDLTREAAHYGLGLTLGDGEVRLWQLAGAYRALALGGFAGAPIFFAEDRPAPLRRVASREASLLLGLILADERARAGAFGRGGALNPGFPVAVKTGTSQAFRDNITAGFDDRFTVAAWVGNADRSAMRGVSGVTGAGPVFAAVFQEVRRRFGGALTLRTDPLRMLDICPLSGLRPGPHCPGRLQEYFIPGHEPAGKCPWHAADGLRLPEEYEAWMKNPENRALVGAVSFERRAPLCIESPRDGAAYRFDLRVGKQASGIAFLARGDVSTEARGRGHAGSGRIFWVLDGQPFAEGFLDQAITATPEPGEHVLTARDEAGRESPPVRFSVR